MSLHSIAQGLADSRLAARLTDSLWLFGTLESVHVLALTLVVGSIALVDLRLIGVGPARGTARQVIDRLLPVTWVGFALALATGGVMIFANPVGYVDNFFFRLKFVLLAAAGVNMLAFHVVVERQLGREGALAPRISGGVSLMLWVSIVGVARWIGYTL